MAPRHTTHFETRKSNCLAKRDKSSAGRIDPRAVEICAALNSRGEYYTTSSCAGRCLLYVGDGIKSWHTVGGDGGGSVAEGGDGASAKHGFFRRFRVSHDLIREPRRYLNLTTLFDGQDPTGGGDPIPTVGQFDHGNNAAFRERLEENNASVPAAPVWLRFEPFILHVMCRSLKAASVLMALARPSFKNVGLTSWNTGRDEGGDVVAEEEGGTRNQQCKGGGPRYLVAIWGDEGLDMPLSLPASPERGVFYDPKSGIDNAAWVAQLVNERHERNWAKIDRFVEAVRGLEEGAVDVDCKGALAGVIHGMDGVDLSADNTSNGTKSDQPLWGLPIPRSYDGEKTDLSNIFYSVYFISRENLRFSCRGRCNTELVARGGRGDAERSRRMDHESKQGDKGALLWAFALFNCSPICLLTSVHRARQICVARTNPLSTQHLPARAAWSNLPVRPAIPS